VEASHEYNKTPTTKQFKEATENQWTSTKQKKKEDGNMHDDGDDNDHGIPHTFDNVQVPIPNSVTLP
jgi:hypothetical protein